MDWNQRWLNEDTPWDIGKEHPLTEQLTTFIESLVDRPHRIYSPGCGRAHDAAFLAKRGHQVYASDFSPKAVEIAQQLYSDVAGLQIEVEDVFNPNPLPMDFDWVFDRAVLCAMPRAKEAEYLERVFERLKPNGLFAGILFSKISVSEEEGPPFSLNDSQIQSLFCNVDVLMDTKIEHTGELTKIAEERLFVVRKNS